MWVLCVPKQLRPCVGRLFDAAPRAARLSGVLLGRLFLLLEHLVGGTAAFTSRSVCMGVCFEACALWVVASIGWILCLYGTCVYGTCTWLWLWQWVLLCSLHGHTAGLCYGLVSSTLASAHGRVVRMDTPTVEMLLQQHNICSRVSCMCVQCVHPHWSAVRSDIAALGLCTHRPASPA